MASAAGVWARFSSDPRVPGAAVLKASDADRDLGTELLREAYADGRLTRSEYDERRDAVLATRTLGGFVPLLSDLLPGISVALRSTDDLRAKAVQKYERDLRDSRNGWIFVSVVTVAIWGATSAASGEIAFFWPIFPIIGVGIGALSVRLHAESRIEAHEERIAEARRVRRARRRDFD